jgi:hypothetical protein
MINGIKNFIYKYLIKSIFYILAKILIFFFSKSLYKNKISSSLFNVSYNFIFKSVSYYNNLRSDLEAIHQLSNLRDEVLIYKKKNKHYNKKKKIIFILNITTSSDLTNLIHLKKFIKLFDVYIFEISKNKEDTKLHLNFFKKKINYFKKNQVKFESIKKNFDIENLSSKINKINADLLIFNIGTSLINIIDRINTKKIISINKTSIFIPHSKIDLQTFQQPPWPYRIQKNKIYNFKTKKIINVNVTDKIFIYSKKNIKINKINYKNKNIILWYGNLKKLADKNFIDSISKILLKYTHLKFYFFGTNTFFLNTIYKYLRLNNVKNFKYLGVFSYIYNSKTSIVHGNLETFKKIVSKTLLMSNTFAMHGGRYALEAYEFNIPIINFQLNDKQWLNNQNKMYYKNKGIFLKECTASNYDEYVRLLKKVIDNEKFRNNVVKNQKVLLNKLTHRDKFYNDVNGLIFE